MFNKKNIIFGTIVIVGIIFTTLWYVSTRVYSFNGNKIEKISIGNNIFYSEIVRDADKMQGGLGGRSSLCQSCAILFQFSTAGKYTFWMKDMRFPLDIIWVSNGRIVYLEKNVSEKFSGIMVTPVDADWVIEINSGVSDKLGIKIGDSVR